MEYEIEVRELQSRNIASIRKVLPMEELPAFFQDTFSGLSSLMIEFGVPLADPPLAVYHEVTEARVDVEAAVPFAEHPPGGTPRAHKGIAIIYRELEGGPSLYAAHKGPYEKLEGLYRALEDWLEQHRRKPRGPTYEIYLTDPQTQPDPGEWLTEVYMPLEPEPERS